MSPPSDEVFPNEPTPASVIRGVPHFPDTFLGPQTRAYADRIAMDRTRLRGTLAWFYERAAMTRRIDGEAPGEEKEGLSPIDRRAHAGFALYGEPVTLGPRIDSVRREVKPDWTYKEPVELRGIAYDPSDESDPDERGSIFINRLQFDIARALCESVGITPRRGDVVLLPKLFNSFYDIEEAEHDESKFGSTGFFVSYKLTLVRMSKFTPPRKELPVAPTERE